VASGTTSLPSAAAAPLHYVDYQTKAGDGAGPDAGAVGEEYVFDENDIRASYAPAGEHIRA
jgi:hypothetical protein